MAVDKNDVVTAQLPSVTRMESGVVKVALELYKQSKVRMLAKEPPGAKYREFLEQDLKVVDELIARFS